MTKFTKDVDIDKRLKLHSSSIKRAKAQRKF